MLPKQDEAKNDETDDIASEEDGVDLDSVGSVTRDEEYCAGDHETEAEEIPYHQSGHVQDRKHGAGTHGHEHHETNDDENEKHEAETHENEGCGGADHKINNATMRNTEIGDI